MYGTPLTAEARFKKIDLQKSLILDIWQRASSQASQNAENDISIKTLTPILQKQLPYSELGNGDWQINLENNTLTIAKRDKRQYSSVAYALRAILAVQQDLLLKPEKQLLPLSENSIKELQNFLDVLTLGVLQIADQDARLFNHRKLTAEKFAASWEFIAQSNAPYLEQQNLTPIKSDFQVIKKIIAQKVAAYQAYNHISMQIFTRNLQVYFAKHPWPKDPGLGKAFKDIYTEAMIQYTHDLIRGAEKLALE